MAGIGFNCKIELVETATLREQMRTGKIGMFRASWIADYPDEESFTTVFYSQNPAPPNYTRFKNIEFDRLYQLAIQEKIWRSEKNIIIRWIKFFVRNLQ